MTSDAYRLREAIREWALIVTDEAVIRLEHQARTGQEVPRKTGELARSINRKVTRVNGDRMETGLTAGVIQAATTDKGAKAHVIRPRKGAYMLGAPGGKLVFYWPKVGRVIGLPYVNHPGNRGIHWWKAFHERRWADALRTAARARRL